MGGADRCLWDVTELRSGVTQMEMYREHLDMGVCILGVVSWRKPERWSLVSK